MTRIFPLPPALTLPRISEETTLYEELVVYLFDLLIRQAHSTKQLVPSIPNEDTAVLEQLLEELVEGRPLGECGSRNQGLRYGVLLQPLPEELELVCSQLLVDGLEGTTTWEADGDPPVARDDAEGGAVQLVFVLPQPLGVVLAAGDHKAEEIPQIRQEDVVEHVEQHLLLARYPLGLDEDHDVVAVLRSLEKVAQVLDGVGGGNTAALPFAKPNRIGNVKPRACRPAFM